MPRGQEVSPHDRGRRKAHFLVWTSTIFGADVYRRVVEKLVQRKFALIIWPLTNYINFSGPEAVRWGRVFHAMGWGSKKLVPCLETQGEPIFSPGCPRKFRWNVASGKEKRINIMLSHELCSSSVWAAIFWSTVSWRSNGVFWAFFLAYCMPHQKGAKLP